MAEEQFEAIGSRALSQFKLRLPEPLKESIELAASRSGRSISAEMIFRLEESFSDSEYPLLDANLLAERLSEISTLVEEAATVIIGKEPSEEDSELVRRIDIVLGMIGRQSSHLQRSIGDINKLLKDYLKAERHTVIDPTNIHRGWPDAHLEKSRVPGERMRININEPYEVRYWANKFGVTEEQLRDAVRTVGVMGNDVNRHLKR